MAKHTLTLHYSVQNGGDGSAYPSFFESAELAELDQQWEADYGEGWGESCTGKITLESDSPISVVGKDVTTKQSLIDRLNEDFKRHWLDEDEYNAKMEDLRNL